MLDYVAAAGSQHWPVTPLADLFLGSRAIQSFHPHTTCPNQAFCKALTICPDVCIQPSIPYQVTSDITCIPESPLGGGERENWFLSNWLWGGTKLFNRKPRAFMERGERKKERKREGTEPWEGLGSPKRGFHWCWAHFLSGGGRQKSSKSSALLLLMLILIPRFLPIVVAKAETSQFFFF